MNVAIIPARGGSKRIPRKNIRLFAGKPIIAHSIACAQECGLFDRIIVSTDDLEIAEISISFGAETPFLRCSNLADDHASTEDVLIDALEWLGKYSHVPEYFCCIYPTAPFLLPEFLHASLRLLKCHQATTSFPVTNFASSIYRALKINDFGRIVSIWPEYRDKRSQELPEAYHDVGQFYWGHSKSFLMEKQLHSSNAIPLLIPRKFACDIDSQEDWEIAELMYRMITINPFGTLPTLDSSGDMP